MKQPPSREQLEHWIDATAHEGVNLTTWEEQFIYDMQVLVAGGRPFTDRQAEHIERIYAERTP